MSHGLAFLFTAVTRCVGPAPWPEVYQRELWQLVNANAQACRKAVALFEDEVPPLRKQLNVGRGGGGGGGGGDADTGDCDGAASAAPNRGPSGLKSSYYHFDSTGKRLPSKWDSYDIDAELEQLEAEERAGAGDGAGGGASRSDEKQALQRMQALQLQMNQATGDVEHVLTQLDQVRGDDARRKARKRLVSDMNKLLVQLDGLRKGTSA